MLSERLRDLDNRVLKIDKHEAALRTEEGWRRHARRWRWLASVAAIVLITPVVARVLGDDFLSAWSPAGGVLAFQAGIMKAEDDRLNRRGRMERLRPPGL